MTSARAKLKASMRQGQHLARTAPAYDRTHTSTSYFVAACRFIISLGTIALFLGYTGAALMRYGVRMRTYPAWNNCMSAKCQSDAFIAMGMALTAGWVKSFVLSPAVLGWCFYIHLLIYIFTTGDNSMVSILGQTFELTKSAYRTKVQTIVHLLRFVKYLGVHPRVSLPKNDPVRLPLSYFTQSLFQMFAPTRLAVALSTYKRVNPLAELKIQALRKFDVAQQHADNYLLDDFIALAHEYAPWQHESFRDALHTTLSNTADFSDVTFEGSSAAGYPYPAGTKRRDVAREAAADAAWLLEQMGDGVPFKALLKPYVHYATGRAKLLVPSDADACRLIIYQSFATFLIMQKYAEPFTQHFVSAHRPSWSAIGFSWFNRGANKLAHELGLIDGMAPSDSIIGSSDVSNWDASLNRYMLRGACAFHCEVIRNTVDKSLAAQWVPIVEALYEHMIFAEVVFPGGHTFQLPGGMKSGWNLTSIDNTIIHEIVFRRASVAQWGRVVPHKLYGDDNIFVAPSTAEFTPLYDAYSALGLKLKHVHHSRHSCDVDFLSKNLRYNAAHKFYYPWRPTVESDARMLMPEDFDPLLVPASDAVASAEVIMGHLFDNFFNSAVRDLCYKMLQHIRDNYNIQEVDPSRSMRAYKHKGFPDVFRTKLPTVPSADVLYTLYGVSPGIQTELDDALATLRPPSFDKWKRTPVAIAALYAEAFCRQVNDLGGTLSNVLNCRVRWATRHFALTAWSSGTGGMKALEALRNLGYSSERPLKSILDIGGHPGSVARTVSSASPTTAITTVSTMYEADVREGYPFMYKAPCRPCDTRIIGDYRTVTVDAHFSHAHIDVTYEDMPHDVKYGSEAAAAEWIKRTQPMIDKAIKQADTMSIVLPSLCDALLPTVHQLIRRADHYDIIKPLFSHPWNTEVVFVWSRGHGHNVRMKDVRAMCRSYRCALAGRLTTWTYMRLANIAAAKLGQAIRRTPWATDKRIQAALVKDATPDGWAMPPSLDFDPDPTL